MFEYLLYLLAFFTGFFTKLTDLIIDHSLKLFKKADVLFGAIYGLLIAITIIYFPIITPLWLGVIIGVMITGKIDSISHWTAISIITASLLIFGIPQLNLLFLLFFIAASMFDEIANIMIERFDIRNTFAKFIELRPTLEITALTISILTGRWEFFLAILSFDAAYILTPKIISSIAKMNRQLKT